MSKRKFTHAVVLFTFFCSVVFLTAITNTIRSQNTEQEARTDVLCSVTNPMALTDYYLSFILDEDAGDSNAGFDVLISSSDLITVGRTVEFSLSFTTTSFSTHTGFWGDEYVVIGAQITSATITFQFKTSSLSYISGASEAVPVSGLTFDTVSQTKNSSKTISIPNDQNIAFLTISLSFSGSLHQTKNGADQGWLSASGVSSGVNIPVSSDEEAPVLTSPSDIQYTVGTSGHNITWISTDDYPDIYTIYRNGSSVATGSWISGSPIIINIDYLAESTYNYSILVTDEYGNKATDVVFVTVTPEVATTPSFEFWLLFFIVPIIISVKGRKW